MVELELPKLQTWVRFPSPAPFSLSLQPINQPAFRNTSSSGAASQAFVAVPGMQVNAPKDCKTIQFVRKSAVKQNKPAWISCIA
jgi:hypothetical protein